MKRIVLDCKEEEIHYSKINDQNFIGYMTNDTHKFMAIKVSGIIVAIGKTNFIGNDKACFSDMQNAVKDQHKAFKFESFEELIRWMSE